MDAVREFAGNPMDAFFALEFQKVLLKLAKEDTSDWEESIRRITREDALTLKLERVSVWLYDEARTEITCECLYKTSEDVFEKGLSLKAKDYPIYFRALEENRTVAADNAMTDPRTAEFAEGYLKPLDIASMMDVPIRLHGQIIGVVCHEHTGPVREWTMGDQDFAASIADLVSLSYESSRRKKVESELQTLSTELEERIRARTRQLGQRVRELETLTSVISKRVMEVKKLEDENQKLREEIARLRKG